MESLLPLLRNGSQLLLVQCRQLTTCHQRTSLHPHVCHSTLKWEKRSYWSLPTAYTRCDRMFVKGHTST